jgi:hypothetical protein
MTSTERNEPITRARVLRRLLKAPLSFLSPRLRRSGPELLE